MYIPRNNPGFSPSISPSISHLIELPEVEFTPPSALSLFHSDQTLISPLGTASKSVNFDELYAEADLNIEIKDINGVSQVGRNDLYGKIDGSIKINKDAFYSQLNGMVGSNGIRKVSFSSKERAYILNIRKELVDLKLFSIGDSFKTKLKVNNFGDLMLKVQDNWLPDSKIINKFKSTIRKLIKNKVNEQFDGVDIEIKMRRHKNKLYFTPVIKNLDVAIAKNHRIALNDLSTSNQLDLKGSFYIDHSGNLEIRFNETSFTGSSKANGRLSRARGKADKINLDIQARAHKNGQAHIDVRGDINIDISEREAKGIAFKDEKLSKYIESVNIHADIDSQIEIKGGKVTVTTNNNWKLSDAKIQGKTYQIASDGMEINLDNKKGLQIEVNQDHQVKPFKANLTQNTIETLIDGPTYFSELINSVRQARESIDIETFLYYDGDKTRKLARELALKAAGLREGSSRLRYDPEATSGIPVHILFNNIKLNQAGADKTIKIFNETLEQLRSEIKELPLTQSQKNLYINRLNSHFKWQPLIEGVARADHRKLIVIDGQIGFTGGINLGEHFLSEDSYHDVMLKVTGPAVREMHQNLEENWSSFGGNSNETFNLKSVEQLNRFRNKYARQNKLDTALVDIITTDQNSTEIESAIIDTINNATTEINIEHPYFYHPPTQQALLKALERGVTINMMIPERSDESIYDILNTQNIKELMEAQQSHGKGKVNAYLYDGHNRKQGRKTHMAHTKAISVDGQYALIGSANLTPRSLQSAFYQTDSNGEQSQILFNEEMNYFIKDSDTVSEINRDLFEFDRQNNAKKIDYSDVIKRMHSLGGASKLRENRLKANLG